MSFDFLSPVLPAPPFVLEPFTAEPPGSGRTLEITGRRDNVIDITGRRDNIIDITGRRDNVFDIEGSRTMPIQLQGKQFSRGEKITVRLTMPEDITGWTLAAGWKYELSTAGDPLLPKTVANGGIVIAAGTGGLATITWTHANTLTLLGGSNPWLDVWRIDAGEECRLVYGQFAVLKQGYYAP